MEGGSLGRNRLFMLYSRAEKKSWKICRANFLLKIPNLLLETTRSRFIENERETLEWLGREIRYRQHLTDPLRDHRNSAQSPSPPNARRPSTYDLTSRSWAASQDRNVNVNHRITPTAMSFTTSLPPPRGGGGGDQPSSDSTGRSVSTFYFPREILCKSIFVGRNDRKKEKKNNTCW